MLIIKIPESEQFNSVTNEFIYIKEQTLNLEHSLLSLTKWEAKWKRPFLHTKKKTWEQSLDYFRCMTINKNVDPVVYMNLPKEAIDRINRYIEDPMTATTFKEEKGGGNSEIVTSEIIYFWMLNYGIPFECEKWHLNHLLALIQVCSIKSQTSDKKMSNAERLARYKDINRMRRKRLNTKG